MPRGRAGPPAGHRVTGGAAAPSYGAAAQASGRAADSGGLRA